MAQTTTIQLATEIAALLNEEPNWLASADVAETGRVVLRIEVLDDEEESEQEFMFLGGEVSR